MGGILLQSAAAADDHALIRGILCRRQERQRVDPAGHITLGGAARFDIGARCIGKAPPSPARSVMLASSRCWRAESARL